MVIILPILKQLEIGIDIDSKYVEITNNKLEDVKPRLISGCYVSNFLDKVINVRDEDWDKIKEAIFYPTGSAIIGKKRNPLAS